MLQKRALRVIMHIFVLAGMLGGTAVPGHAIAYVHDAFITLEWTAASGAVDSYSVLVSINAQPYQEMLEVQAPGNDEPVRCVLMVEDLNTYRVIVQAFSEVFGLGPRSLPSEPIKVFLNGYEGDTDGDGLPNEWEELFGMNPYDPGDAASDTDGDLLSNLDEFRYGTDPMEIDSDHDGVGDGGEILSGMNPLDPLDNLPRADAGPNVSGLTGQFILLDGSKSWDPNGDPLNYRWVQKSGTKVTLEGEDTATCGFFAYEPDEYVFALYVSDGKAESRLSLVHVWISGEELGPVARAGRDFLAPVEGPVILDGMESGGPVGEPLFFSWEQVDGPVVVLSDPENPMPRFQPAGPGFYTFELVVYSGNQESSPDEVVVQVVDELFPGDISPRGNLDGKLDFLDLTLWWCFYLNLIEPTSDEIITMDVAPMTILSEEGNEVLIRLEPDGEIGLEDGGVLLDIANKVFRVIGWESAPE